LWTHEGGRMHRQHPGNHCKLNFGGPLPRQFGAENGAPQVVPK
jgi:hypothetical protein